METQTAPKRYVHNDFGDFGEPNNSQTLRIYWFWRFLGAKTGRVGRPKKLPNVTYTMISVILDAPKTLKRYAYNGFSDCGTCGCPKSSQTLRICRFRGHQTPTRYVYNDFDDFGGVTLPKNLPNVTYIQVSEPPNSQTLRI